MFYYGVQRQKFPKIERLTQEILYELFGGGAYVKI